MTSDYHHGDLPCALRAAAVELISEKGPNGFSLREVARRAGVSHAAPAHHFGDAQGLLTSVATEGFAVLSDNMRQVHEAGGPARTQITELGRSYVHTALANPGHYGVMIGHGYTDKENPDLIAASVAAYSVLIAVLQQVRDEYNPDLTDDELERRATLTWSTVHGLVELAPILGHVAEHTNTANNELDVLLEQFSDMIIASIKP